MKKTAIALAMATVLGVAGTAMAANPFTDVPANHWSYASVAKLAQAGIVEGYGDGTFQGNNTMTRYEMAQIVAKAMAKSDKADAAQKAMIEKLAAEYSAELNNLGVRVSALEKKTDNVKITGEARIARQTFDNSVNGVDRNDVGDTFTVRSRITFTGAINDDWKYVGRYQDTQNMENSDADYANNGAMNMAYVQGPVAGATVTAGRQSFFTGYGLVFDSYVDGVQVAFGNQLKTNLVYGKIGNANANELQKDTTAYASSNKFDIAGVGFSYAPSKAVGLKAGYYNIGANDVEDAGVKVDDLHLFEVGFDWKFAKDLTLIGTYAKSNAEYAADDKQDTAWKARVNYRAANLTNANSYGLYAEYRDQEAGGTWDPTGNMDYVYNGTNNTTMGAGFKGYMVGGQYVLAKNVKFESEYYHGKDTLKNYDAKTNSFWNALYFYF